MRGGGDHWVIGGGCPPPPRYMEPSYERPRTLKTLYGDEGGGHRIHMRGLPFRATEEDIADVRIANLIICFWTYFQTL